MHADLEEPPHRIAVELELIDRLAGAHLAQLGGTALIEPDGQIVWTHVQQDASDNPSIEEILEAVGEHVA